MAGVAVLYDLFLGATEHDTAVITAKSQTTGRGASRYINAHGRLHYVENVPASFWKLCQTGDSLEIFLTPVFKEWRHVTLFRSGTVIAEATGRDIFYMVPFGVAFVSVAVASIFMPDVLLRKPVYWTTVSVIDFVAVMLVAKYLAVLAGAAEKM